MNGRLKASPPQAAGNALAVPFIRFLIRGLLRDRSRSLFPIIMVAAGSFLTVLLFSYMQGVIGDMVDASARFDTGHVRIMTRAYSLQSDQMPNDLALLDGSELLETVRRQYPGMIWTARIKFGGLIDIPDAAGETRSQGPAFGLGVDLFSPASPEPKLLNLEKALVRGKLPSETRQILISDAFARKLEIEPGDTATLIGSTMYGSMSVTNFVISGTVRFGIQALDRHMIIADLSDMRAALDMEDAAGEIVGYTTDGVYADDNMQTLAAGFNRTYGDANDPFAPVMLRLGEQGLFKEFLAVFNSIGSLIVGVFVLAMSIVLWNAGLMNGLRRYGEIGVRLALGESKGGLYRAMVLESICIGIIGSLIGTALGLAAAGYLQYVGLDFSAMFQKSSVMMSTVMRARVTPGSFIIGFIPGVLASALGTMFAGIGIFRRQTAQLFKELEV